MLKVLITGASGFVGQHLLEDMDHSRFDTTVITRKPDKQMRVMPHEVKILKADLNDQDSLINAFSGIEVLINTAAEIRNADKLILTNINGTLNLIKAVVENKIRKVIHLSSVGVVGMQYSSQPMDVNENTDCDPKNEYERTKLESERMLTEASRKYGFELVILRPTNVFGEYHPYNSLLNFMQHIISGKPMVQTTGALVNYVYVKDLSAAILAFVNNEHPGKTYNVGEAMLLKNFTDLIAASLHKKNKKIFVPQFLVNFISGMGLNKLNTVSNRVRYDDSQLKTSFQYRYGIKVGLERTVAHYKEKGMIE
jgi:nucleoside-diphosphate-sugar epimerase